MGVGGFAHVIYYRKNGVTFDLNKAVPPSNSWITDALDMNEQEVILCQTQDLTTGDFFPAVLTPVYPIDGDTNCDETVSVLDLLEVINAWGSTGGYADLDGNGMVNSSDLELVLLHWGIRN